MSTPNNWAEAFAAGNPESRQRREDIQATAQADPTLIPFLLKMLQETDHAKQLAALDSLKLLGTRVPVDAARDPFLVALKSASRDVRDEAATALVPTHLAKDDVILEHLEVELKGNYGREVPMVRSAQVFALGTAPKGHRALAFLKWLSENDPDSAVQQAAKEAWEDQHPVGALIGSFMKALHCSLEEAYQAVAASVSPRQPETAVGGFAGGFASLPESQEPELFEIPLGETRVAAEYFDQEKHLILTAKHADSGKLALFITDKDRPFFTYVFFREAPGKVALASVPLVDGVDPKSLQGVFVDGPEALVDVEEAVLRECAEAQIALDSACAEQWDELEKNRELSLKE